MSSRCVCYEKVHYKYSLIKPFAYDTGIVPPTGPVNIGDYVHLSADGKITFALGYSWDGASGPAIDTQSFMRGSLVHDGLYQLMREGLLDRDRLRKAADKVMRKICREDGMGYWRAAWTYRAVRWFGEAATKPDSSSRRECAPREHCEHELPPA